MISETYISGHEPHPKTGKLVQTEEERKRRRALRAKRRYNNNVATERAKQNARRLANRDQYNAYRNNYRTKNPNGIYDVIRQSAKRRHIEISLSRQDFVLWYNSQDRVCIYCMRDEVDVNNDVDIIQSIAKRLSIDRLNNNAGYCIDNIGLACRRCNTIKGNYFSFNEMKQIGLIIKIKHASK